MSACLVPTDGRIAYSPTAESVSVRPSDTPRVILPIGKSLSNSVQLLPEFLQSLQPLSEVAHCLIDLGMPMKGFRLRRDVHFDAVNVDQRTLPISHQGPNFPSDLLGAIQPLPD